MANGSTFLATCLVLALPGCTQEAPAIPAAASAPVDADPQSILSAARPAPGATTGPVEELTLRFDPPARLDELRIDGPSGGTAIMIGAIAELPEFRVPADLQAKGEYSVHWRAHIGTTEHAGQYRFSVK